MEQGIRVNAIAQPASALQYLPETEALLNGLDLPTGKVTVQLADEMNRVSNRCYVPTTWGSAVLEYGDWVVSYDSGIVLAATATQFVSLFNVSNEPRDGELDFASLEHPLSMRGMVSGVETLTLKEMSNGVAETAGWEAQHPAAPAAVLRFRAAYGDSSWLPSFQAYCARYRLDYSLVSEDRPRGGDPDYRVVVNATGREVIAFGLGELVDCYPDGSMVVVQEAAQA